jgi:hypothetical protein
MASSGMLRRVALVRTDVSVELSASTIRVKIISELGTTLAATDARCRSVRRLLVAANDVHSSTYSCHPDEGGAKFIRNVGACKSHTA